MIGDLTNHLWQSTLFALAAGLLAVALRKNGAHIRHLVWLTASLKFLVPFSLLLGLGSQLAWTRPASPGVEASTMETVSVVMDQIAQPFTDVFPSAPAAPQAPVDWIPTALVAVWACGFAGIALLRLRDWRRVREAIRQSVTADLKVRGYELEYSAVRRGGPSGPPNSIAIRSSPGLLEPGVVGLWRPVLLLPAGIENQLTPLQLEAVLAHELCHIRRRDNVTAAIHMIVEAVFWFHPLVWWIGARMVDERERACDEHVLRVLGKPEAYAEGILNVCKLYVESPLTCVSGVTGSNLKKRIEAIMVNRVGLRLNLARKTGIAVAAALALAAPIIVGMITSPVPAGAQAASGGAQFEVVSIKPCAAERILPGVAPPAQAGFRRGGAGGFHAQTTPGHVYWDCVTLATLIDQAYADVDHPLLNMVGDSRPPRTDGLGPNQPRRVRGGPSWVASDMFTIEAKAPIELTSQALPAGTGRNLVTLPSRMSLALRAVLEDRFKVKVRRVAEQQDMYALKVGEGGLDKTRVTLPVPGDCGTREQHAEWMASAPLGPPPRTTADAEARMKVLAAAPRICGGLFSSMTGMEFSSATLSQLATDLSQRMDKYVLDQTGIDTKFNFQLRSGDGETADQRQAAAVGQLGLKLQPVKAQAEHLFIDRAEKPTPNFAAFAASSGKPDSPSSGVSSKLLPILALSTSAGQTAASKFEVASIKPCEQQPVAPGARGGGARMESSPGRLHISCFRLALLVDSAYIARNRDSGVEGWPFMGGSAYNGREPGPLKARGGPAWVYNEQWTIEAKAATAADEDTMMGPMLRALLEDRFQLKIHTEAEDVPMWTLTVAKGGLKIKPNKEGDCNPGRDFQGILMSRAVAEGIKPTCGMVNGGPNGTNWRWEHGGQSLGTVAGMLSGDLGAAVLDRTGVTDNFNLMWEYGPDENTPRALQNMQRFAPGGAPPTAANIFTALEDQLGLKLEKVKGSRGYIVIDRAERPGPDLVGRADLEARPQRGLQDQAALRTAIVRKRT